MAAVSPASAVSVLEAETLEDKKVYIKAFVPEAAREAQLAAAVLKANQPLALLEGQPRPRWSSLFSLVVLCVVGGYGIIRYTQLLQHDVHGGVRCPTQLRPLEVCGYAFAASLALLVFTLRVCDRAVKAADAERPVRARDEERTERRARLGTDGPNAFGDLVRLLSTLQYEGVQLAVTFFGIWSWAYGMQGLAQIDEPGDEMHMLYVHGGHKHATRNHPDPWEKDNPLGINHHHVNIFFRTEFFALWSFLLSALLTAVARLWSPRTVDSLESWVLFDCMEVGCILGVAYPRILDHWGLYGAKFGGFSPFIFGGFFRFGRILRFQRLVFLLYHKRGLSKTVNGVMVRYYALLIKFIAVFMMLATVIGALEYPCAVNAVRNDNAYQLERCNVGFKRFDICVYFMVVTLSTVGYGDLYPATQAGRIFMLLVIVGIVALFPTLVAEIQELSDGDDVSDQHKILLSVNEAWCDVADLADRFDKFSASNAQNTKDQRKSVDDAEEMKARQADLAQATAEMRALLDDMRAMNARQADPAQTAEEQRAFHHEMHDMRARQAELVWQVRDAFQLVARSEEQTMADLEHVRALALNAQRPEAEPEGPETGPRYYVNGSAGAARRGRLDVGLSAKHPLVTEAPPPLPLHYAYSTDGDRGRADRADRADREPHDRHRSSSHRKRSAARHKARRDAGDGNEAPLFATNPN
mmetsp:Transcript_20967/g.72209  ORF Transcript_20967/g.72209 Transcript_20967/m.72209 type:complete len:697 (+) Transcript_20967:169-2259(+)